MSKYDPNTQPLECMNFDEECEGPVEMHSLDGLKWWPRCELHFGVRVDQYENSIERYANSDIPPSWFDPSYAGESWDNE